MSVFQEITWSIVHDRHKSAPRHTLEASPTGWLWKHERSTTSSFPHPHDLLSTVPCEWHVHYSTPTKGKCAHMQSSTPTPSSTTTDLGERKAVTSRLYHAMRWNKYRYPRYVNDHNLAFFLNMKKKDLENLCDFVIYRPCVARKPWIFPRRRFFFSFPSRLPPPLDNHSLGSLAYNYAASFFPSFFSRLSCD